MNLYKLTHKHGSITILAACQEAAELEAEELEAEEQGSGPIHAITQDGGRHA